jgi:hypothetical protein
MIDAMRLLGSLLGNNATSSGLANQILNNLANSLSGGRGAAPGQGNDIGALLGNLAIAALQQFAQSQSPSTGSRSVSAALSSGLGAMQLSAVEAARPADQALADQALVRA